MDLVILNLGQVIRIPLLTTTSRQQVNIEPPTDLTCIGPLYTAGCGLVVKGVAEFDRQIQKGDSRQHGATDHHRTWGRKPHIVGVILNGFEGCDVEWNEKGNKRTRSKKSGVLIMPAEATRIRDVRSSSVDTGVSYSSCFRGYPEEIQGIEVWGAWRPSHRFTVSKPTPGICSMEMAMHRNRKCSGKPSSMNHTSWCVVAGAPCRNFGRTCCRKTRYFAPLRHSGSICISPHSFDHFPRLAHRPPDGYYYPDFR
ncbi:hypothetical protein TNCV_4191501 [Trichonephila clavipes]|nr:hypothetical protein TNCV_4191501 [Trichonephila clavipes]